MSAELPQGQYGPGIGYREYSLLDNPRFHAAHVQPGGNPKLAPPRLAPAIVQVCEVRAGRMKAMLCVILSGHYFPCLSLGGCLPKLHPGKSYAVRVLAAWEGKELQTAREACAAWGGVCQHSGWAKGGGASRGAAASQGGAPAHVYGHAAGLWGLQQSQPCGEVRRALCT